MLLCLIVIVSIIVAWVMYDSGLGGLLWIPSIMLVIFVGAVFPPILFVVILMYALKRS